jgi:hypothetical protein
MKDEALISWMVGVGVAIGMGQLLSGGEKLTARLMCGRALVSGGLGLAAGTAMTVMPNIPLPALVGISCVLVSLGTSSLERIVQRWINGGTNGGT